VRLRLRLGLGVTLLGLVCEALHIEDHLVRVIVRVRVRVRVRIMVRVRVRVMVRVRVRVRVRYPVEAHHGERRVARAEAELDILEQPLGGRRAQLARWRRLGHRLAQRRTRHRREVRSRLG